MAHPERPWELCTTFSFICLMCFFICILCNTLYNKLVNVFSWVLWVTQLHSCKPKRGLWEAQCIVTHIRVNQLGLVTDIWIELGREVSVGDSSQPVESDASTRQIVLIWHWIKGYTCHSELLAFLFVERNSHTSGVRSDLCCIVGETEFESGFVFSTQSWK
jgi:hypothetical protein